MLNCNIILFPNYTISKHPETHCLP